MLEAPSSTWDALARHVLADAHRAAAAFNGSVNGSHGEDLPLRVAAGRRGRARHVERLGLVPDYARVGGERVGRACMLTHKPRTCSKQDAVVNSVRNEM